MSATSALPMFLQFFNPNNSGAPAVGFQLFTYQAGTTTKQATWTDSSQGTQNANPLALDANGRAIVWGNPTLSYKFVLAPLNSPDPPTSPVWTQDDIEFPLDLSVLTQAVIGGILYPQTAAEVAAGVTPANYAYADGNVLRYGADPTGINDSTAAFNTATFADFAGWTPTENTRLITIPSGRYKLSGTVYVRSGQAVIGAGQGTYLDCTAFGAVETNVFLLGWGLINGSPTQDSGGQPVEVAELFFLGGPSAGGAAIAVKFPGCLVHDCWFSACGLGVYLSGGVCYDCTFDIGLEGIIIGPGTNQRVDSCEFFNQNYAILFDLSGADISDTIVSNCSIEYPQYVGVSAASGGSAQLLGVKFVGCNFTYNEQYSTYSALVSLSPSKLTQIEFQGCSFHNWPGYAVQVGSIEVEADFIGCIFDGNQTNSAYAQSTTSAGIALSGGRLRLLNCIFDNLDSYGVAVSGSSVCYLDMAGCVYNNVGGASFIDITNSYGGSYVVATGVKADPTTPFVNTQSVVPVHVSYTTQSGGTVFSGPLGCNGASGMAAVTGWGAPTDAAVQIDYSGSSATLAETSAAVAYIIATLKSFGLFGA